MQGSVRGVKVTTAMRANGQAEPWSYGGERGTSIPLRLASVSALPLLDDHSRSRQRCDLRERRSQVIMLQASDLRLWVGDDPQVDHHLDRRGGRLVSAQCLRSFFPDAGRVDHG